MNLQIKLAADNVRKMSSDGYLVVPLGERAFLEGIAAVLQAGLAKIRKGGTLRETLLRGGRGNKDDRGRLRVGYYETDEDDMTQFNFSDYADGFASDCLELDPDLKDFFAALNTVNELMRTHTHAFARATDLLLKETGYRGVASVFSVTHIAMHAKYVTSAMDYIPKHGSALTNARPNTAALAAYWLATNPGMQVVDRFGEVHELSAVEKDPSRALFIPGEGLQRVTQDLIEASKHPIIPNEPGARRFSLRSFGYF